MCLRVHTFADLIAFQLLSAIFFIRIRRSHTFFSILKGEIFALTHMQAHTASEKKFRQEHVFSLNRQIEKYA